MIDEPQVSDDGMEELKAENVAKELKAEELKAENVALWCAAKGHGSGAGSGVEPKEMAQVQASLRRSHDRLDAGDREAARLRAELAALRVAPGMIPATALMGVVVARAGAAASFALGRSIASLERDVAKQRAALARCFARWAISFHLRLLQRAFERLQCRTSR